MERLAAAIKNGYDVYSSDGKKVGSVKECTDIYCRISTGFLGLGPTYYVPAAAVERAGDGEVHLNVPGDRLERMDWEKPPHQEEAVVEDNEAVPLDKATVSESEDPEISMDETTIYVQPGSTGPTDPDEKAGAA